MLQRAKGFGNFQEIGNNKIAIKSPNWFNPVTLAINSGAVTFADLFTGIAGTVADTNSLVGSNNIGGVGDDVGNSVLVQLSSGNYYLRTPNWKGTAGAITFIDPASPPSGVIGPLNSLVGLNSGTPGDSIGNGGIVDLGNGRSLVFSPYWDGDKGAVTWFNNNTGTIGVVGPGNSLDIRVFQLSALIGRGAERSVTLTF